MFMLNINITRGGRVSVWFCSTYFPRVRPAAGHTGYSRTPSDRNSHCKWLSASTGCTSTAQFRSRTPLCCGIHLHARVRDERAGASHRVRLGRWVVSCFVVWAHAR